jgi:hypothetical protein
MTSGETRLRDALQQAGSSPVGDVDFDDLVRRRRRQRVTRWTALAAIVGTVGGVVIWSATSGRDTAGVSTIVPAKVPASTARNVSVDCDGYPVTAEKLSQPGHAEEGTTASSVALRRFLAHNPFEGMGTVPNTGWLLVVDTPTELAFGHREGAVGVGPLISLHLKNGKVVGQNLGGCGTVLVEKGRVSEPVQAAAVNGSSIVLFWSNGSCGGNELDRRLARVEVRESGHAVHVLLVTEANPAAAKGNGADFCAGVGRISQSTVTLRSPLGGKTLYDDSRLVPEVISRTTLPPG